MAIVITGEVLRTLGTSFNALYSGALSQAPTDHLKVATPVPSSTGRNEYGWLGAFPNVREWLGDRVIQGMAAHGYSIVNRDFELTVSVKRNDIEDDNIGIYTPWMQEFGRSVGAFPCELVYSLLKAGFTTNCYDGQYFFDIDHPVLDASGSITSAANTDAAPGNGPAWFLIDASRVLKPIIFQERKPFTFVAKDRPTDDNVFNKKEFVYGSDGRMNVGYGFWQFAWGSTQPLDDAHYTAAKAALSSMKGDYGRPLGLNGTLLVVPPQLERAARAIVKADRDTYGATNVWVDSAEMFMTPWLA